MKKTFTRFIGVLLCLCVFLGSLSLAASVTSLKLSRQKFKPFLEEAEQYDVLFFGTSHMRDGIFPIQLWAEQGICGYNCAVPAATIADSYWGVMNMLDHSSPELVVVDCYQVGFPEKSPSDLPPHSIFDAFPFSLTKLRAALDLGLNEDSYQRAFELIFPFSLYHSRWSELEAEDFSPKLNVENGAFQAVNVSNVSPCEPPTTVEPLALDASMPGVAYLQRLIEECNQRDISVLLTYLPFPPDLDNRREAAAIQGLAEEYGVNYINFLEMDIVDPVTDYYDDFSHLNPSGGQRVTSWLGEYISKNYALPQRWDDPDYAFMERRLEESKQNRRALLAEQNYLSTYLMLLRDKDFSAVAHLPAGSPLGQDALVLALVENIPINQSVSLLRQAVESGEEYLLVVDSASDQVYEFVGAMPQELTCSLGCLRFENDRLYIDGTEYAPAVTDSTATVLDCFVFDSASGQHLGIDRGFMPGVDGFVIAY